MLDGYGSFEILNRYYGFANAEFLGKLSRQGFTVIPDARANYISTADSVNAIWNMQYVDQHSGSQSSDVVRGILARGGGLGHTVAGQVFDTGGYKTIADNTNLSAAAPSPNTAEYIWHVAFNDFSRLIVEQSIFRLVVNDYIATLWIRSPTEGHFNMPVNIQRVVDIARDPAPTLTFVYINAPHPPNYFNRDGTVKPLRESVIKGTNDWSDAEAYIDQVYVVNNVITDIIARIDKESSQEPVMALLGDHGPASQTDGILWTHALLNPSPELIEERTGVLSAMRLPEQCHEMPYANLTGVNIFRFLLRSCFGAELDLLADNTYWGAVDPYELVAQHASNKN